MSTQTAKPSAVGARLAPRARSRVLVAYESRLGSTAEVAAFIGDVLAEEGVSADVEALERVADLENYDRVVVGSAIRYDRWLPEATRFVEANQSHLRRVPVAFFFTCLVLARGTAKAEEKAEGYASRLARLLPGAERVDVGGFAGVLAPSKAPWPTRWLLRALSAVSGVSEGDHRDWEAIRSWTRNLFAQPAPVTETPLRSEPSGRRRDRPAGSLPSTA